MKLIYTIIGRMAVALLPILALWSVIFYFTMVSEINDETDDSLEGYAELIIRRTLVGKELPAVGDGSNNSFTLECLGDAVSIPPSMHYKDSVVYIAEKRETEPARVLTAYFSDARGVTYRLLVTTPTFEREDLLSAMFWHILVLYIAVVATVFLATYIVFQRSMRPLYKLLAWLDNYIPGRGIKDFPSSSSVVEFRKLIKSAESTITRAEEHFEQQKQFIGNASHELQTPLAVLGNRIEWILNSTSLTDEQAGELYKMQQSLRRLVHMNRTLLLLAKIDNGQFLDTSDVDIVPLIKDNVEMFSDVYAQKELKTDISLPVDFIVHKNAELISIMITNLVKNAFLHSSDGADIAVYVEKGNLVIANSGAAPLDEKRLFDRFYKAGKSGSTGLGLALVGAVARSCDIKVEYSFSQGMNRFTIWF